MGTAKSQHEIPYGLKDGRAVHISKAETGGKCGCVCPKCNGPLIAKNREFEGRQNDYHFAHKSKSNCLGALETSLHYGAKEILNAVKVITLPSLEFEFFNDVAEPLVLSAARKVRLHRVEVETNEGDIRPDLVAFAKDKNGDERKLMIEIHVTNPVSDEKLEKVKGMGISMIEINLSDFDRVFDEDALKDLLCNSSDRKEWLYSTEEAWTRELAKQLLNGIWIKSYGDEYDADYCPIGIREDQFSISSGAKVYEDCKHCIHAILIGKSRPYINGPQSIYCTAASGLSPERFRRILQHEYKIRD